MQRVAHVCLVLVLALALPRLGVHAGTQLDTSASYVCEGLKWRMTCIPWTINEDSFPESQREAWVQDIRATMNTVSAVLAQERVGVSLSRINGGDTAIAELDPGYRPCNWISFKYQQGPVSSCESQIGRVWGYQSEYASLDALECNRKPADVYLGDACFENRLNSIMHEVLHVLGVCHEHQRQDAPSYITVDRALLADPYQVLPYDDPIFFDGESSTAPPCLPLGEYDFDSLTHYIGAYSYSGLNSYFYRNLVGYWTPDMGPTQDRAGQLSAGDIASLKAALTYCEWTRPVDGGFTFSFSLNSCSARFRAELVSTGIAGVFAIGSAAGYVYARRRKHAKAREQRHARREARRSEKHAASSSSDIALLPGSPNPSHGSRASTRRVPGNVAGSTGGRRHNNGAVARGSVRSHSSRHSRKSAGSAKAGLRDSVAPRLAD